MADKFPGPYVDNVPQNVDNPGPQIERVKFSYAEIGARNSVLGQVKAKNNMTISHVGNQGSPTGPGRTAGGGRS